MKTQPVCGSPGSVLITEVGASAACRGLDTALLPRHRAHGREPPRLAGPWGGQQHRWGKLPSPLPLVPAGSGFSPVVSAPLSGSFLSFLTHPAQGGEGALCGRHRGGPCRAAPGPGSPGHRSDAHACAAGSAPTAPRSCTEPEPEAPPETGPSHLGAWEVP